MDVYDRIRELVLNAEELNQKEIHAVSHTVLTSFPKAERRMTVLGSFILWMNPGNCPVRCLIFPLTNESAHKVVPPFEKIVE